MAWALKSIPETVNLLEASWTSKPQRSYKSGKGLNSEKISLATLVEMSNAKFGGSIYKNVNKDFHFISF